MRYFISDLHFFHKNLNEKMDKRGFLSGEEMNEYIIHKWNSKVTYKDEVIILGDFSMGNAQETAEVLRRLKGKKCLIVGNHDSRYLDDKNFDKSLFQWIEHYKVIKDNHRSFILSHYPILCYEKQYRTEPKSYMLYGHVHNTNDELLVNEFINISKQQKAFISGEEVNLPCNLINCFCMFSDYTPLTVDEWIELDKLRRENLNNE